MALSAAARRSLDEAPAEALAPTGALPQAGTEPLAEPPLDLDPTGFDSPADAPAVAGNGPAVQALPSEVARLIADRDRLLSQVASQLAERARVAAALAAEVDRLRGILEVTEATCARLAADLEKARPAAARVEALEGSLAAAMEERDRLIAALERAEAAGAEKEARAAAAAQAQARTALGQAEHVIAGLEEQLAASRAHVEQLEARCREAEAERARLEGLLADAERRAADLEAERAQRAPAPAPQAAKASAAPAAPPAAKAVRSAVVVVLDVEGGWTADGASATVLDPTQANVVARVAETAPACVLANLAAPGALEALGALRAAHPALALRGCVGSADGRVLMLGAIEVATHPLDPPQIVAALAPHAARGTKVLTAGTHADDFMALRQALLQAGMVVSMVWDAKQADDLLEMVRPAIVIVDLAMPRRDGYALLARLATLAPVPTICLIADDATPAEAFAAPLADPAVLQQARPRTRALADLLALPARAASGTPKSGA
jgi:CheY-like chemotaxis protein/ABC-type transporter Mla subunit MlaD